MNSGAELLRSFAGNSTAKILDFVAFPAFRDALLKDIGSWKDKENQPTPFSFLAAQISMYDSVVQLRIWEHILGILASNDADSYDAIHKGEPFYWLSINSYEVHDFERGLFYMDCALSDDHRRWRSEWRHWPAGLFMQLDVTNTNQAGIEIVRQIRAVFDSACEELKLQSGFNFNIDHYRSRLLWRSMGADGSLRTAVTAFVSFLLEFGDRRRQLSLVPASSTAGTSEPFVLHLFKGCLLLETLIKCSPLALIRPKSTLNNFLGQTPIYTALGFSGVPQGLGEASSLADIIAKLTVHQHVNGGQTSGDDILVVWTLRNLIGHNVALPARPSVVEYDWLFHLIFSSLARAITSLYPVDGEWSGVALDTTRQR